VFLLELCLTENVQTETIVILLSSELHNPQSNCVPPVASLSFSVTHAEVRIYSI